MPQGGYRAEAGRTPGTPDSPLTLRTNTTKEAKTLNDTAATIRARTRVAAWEALAKQIENLDNLPAKERAPLIALALKYTEPRNPTVNVTVEGGMQLAGGDLIRHRLQTLAARDMDAITPTTGRGELAAVPDEIVDAELVDPDPAEVLNRRRA